MSRINTTFYAASENWVKAKFSLSIPLLRLLRPVIQNEDWLIQIINNPDQLRYIIDNKIRNLIIIDDQEDVNEEWTMMLQDYDFELINGKYLVCVPSEDNQ